MTEGTTQDGYVCIHVCVHSSVCISASTPVNSSHAHRSPSHAVWQTDRPHPSSQIVRDAPSYKPRYVATLLWATANLDAALPALLTTLVAQLPRCADMPQDAVMALTGLATCRHHPGDAVLQALDMRLASSVCGLRVFETGQALYGFACLGYTPTALLDGLHAAGNQLLVQVWVVERVETWVKGLKLG